MSIRVIQAGETPEPVATVVPPAPVAAPVSEAPTPSETIVRAAASTGTCVGPSGREFVFRKLGPIDRMLLSKALGPELMTNPVYASYAMVAASVSQINGERIAMPGTARQAEAFVSRIGEDWDALNLAIRATFAPPEPEANDDDE